MPSNEKFQVGLVGPRFVARIVTAEVRSVRFATSPRAYKARPTNPFGLDRLLRTKPLGWQLIKQQALSVPAGAASFGVSMLRPVQGRVPVTGLL
jgi:hypothetical protein